jgi:molecular chaperone GrpE
MWIDMAENSKQDPGKEAADEVVEDREPVAANTDGDPVLDEAAETADTVDEAAEDQPQPTPLEVVTAERDELKDRWLRAVAELDNVRKRSRREVVEARRFAQADVLRSLLDVADNFERALASMAGEGEGDGDEAAAGLREGVALIHQRFQAVLRDRDVTIIEALETEFDPNCHEAVGQAPREGTEHGTVIEVVQQGYRFGDMVLRPARVIIAS